MLSTYFNASKFAIQRKATKGVSEDTQKPKAVIEYTANMGRDDRFDQLFVHSEVHEIVERNTFL